MSRWCIWLLFIRLLLLWGVWKVDYTTNLGLCGLLIGALECLLVARDTDLWFVLLITRWLSPRSSLVFIYFYPFFLLVISLVWALFLPCFSFLLFCSSWFFSILFTCNLPWVVPLVPFNTSIWLTRKKLVLLFYFISLSYMCWSISNLFLGFPK